MVSRKTGWRIVTLAAAVYAAASADRSAIHAMDFAAPRPPGEIPNVASGLAARDSQSGGRLVWDGPVPPAPISGAEPVYVPSPAYAPPADIPYAPSSSYEPPAAYEPPAEASLAPTQDTYEDAPPPAAEPGSGDYGRTYPVQETPADGLSSAPVEDPGPGNYGRTYPVQEAPPLVQEASLPPLGAPTVIDDGGALPEGYGAEPDAAFDPWEGLTDVDPDAIEPAPRIVEPPAPPTRVRPRRGAMEAEVPRGYRPIPASEAQCRRELGRLGVRYTDITRVASSRSCGIANPVRVTQAVSGIAMSPPATLTCQAALKVARWLKDDVKPAARWKLWRKPMAVINASSYRCSRIAGSRTISEHAGGNALDVGGFRFADGSTVKVSPKGFFSPREKAFQNAIRRGSCQHFGTVLGPGYNRAHADHLHLDVKARLRPVCK